MSLFPVGKLLNVTQVSECLNIPESTIRGWVHENKIPFIKFGPGKKSPVRFNPEKLNQWVSEKSKEPKSRNQMECSIENTDVDLIPASEETLQRYDDFVRDLNNDER